MVQSNARKFVVNVFEWGGGERLKWFANLVAEPAHQTVIPRILTSTGSQVTDPEGILREFHLFYSQLYDNLYSHTVEAMLEVPASSL